MKKTGIIIYLMIMGGFTLGTFMFIRVSIVSFVMISALIINLLLLMDVFRGDK